MTQTIICYKNKNLIKCKGQNKNVRLVKLQNKVNIFQCLSSFS